MRGTKKGECNHTFKNKKRLEQLRGDRDRKGEEKRKYRFPAFEVRSWEGGGVNNSTLFANL